MHDLRPTKQSLSEITILWKIATALQPENKKKFKSHTCSKTMFLEPGPGDLITDLKSKWHDPALRVTFCAQRVEGLVFLFRRWSISLLSTTLMTEERPEASSSGEEPCQPSTSGNGPEQPTVILVIGEGRSFWCGNLKTLEMSCCSLFLTQVCFQS